MKLPSFFRRNKPSGDQLRGRIEEGNYLPEGTTVVSPRTVSHKDGLLRLLADVKVQEIAAGTRVKLSTIGLPLALSANGTDFDDAAEMLIRKMWGKRTLVCRSDRNNEHNNRILANYRDAIATLIICDSTKSDSGSEEKAA